MIAFGMLIAVLLSQKEK
ncbi:hypothetical protein MOE82_03665 [Bacillus licheniformis]|nr:hypothetical protein [Bacillus haynesii]MCY9349866.1 hypothetical protein [Bacillus licheniformis]MCY8341134.1 hypothetical protein [Bacillus haynesii]MCY8346807.1 hypothetical protein [Bacillus haynesii]MCY8351934.1 hypothetical protein [Bacillus haynesii]